MHIPFICFSIFFFGLFIFIPSNNNYEFARWLIDKSLFCLGIGFVLIELLDIKNKLK